MTGSYWNHRVILTKRKTSQGVETSLDIHEVYYYANGEINGWTQSPTRPWSESIDGLKWVLEKMQAACEKPVLKENAEGDLVEVKRVPRDKSFAE